jgi:hypothetical protein
LAALLGCGESKPPRKWTPSASEQNDDREYLKSAFPLEKAPDFKATQAELARINAVIAEVRGGYGGTLVCDPQDQVLDSPAFLAHYLRAFSIPDATSPEGLKAYDYRFERILARVSSFPKSLDDPRLDWDVFRSFLEYEVFYCGTHEYRIGNTIYGLDGAKDLLWGYLDRNAVAILRDKERLTWWVQHLTNGLEVPGRHPLRPWYVLLLVSETDKLTPANATVEEKTAEGGIRQGLIQPTPRHPFLVITEDAEIPAGFGAAIQKIAQSQKLEHEILGIDSKKMPATKAWEVNMTGRLTQVAIEKIVDQESWSTKRQDFQLYFFRPLGRRSAYFNVRIPPAPCDDGVFFFTYNAKLYVWPKSRMNDAAVHMLRQSQIIDPTEHERLMAKGFKPLTPTP